MDDLETESNISVLSPFLLHKFGCVQYMWPTYGQYKTAKRNHYMLIVRRDNVSWKMKDLHFHNFFTMEDFLFFNIKSTLLSTLFPKIIQRLIILSHLYRKKWTQRITKRALNWQLELADSNKMQIIMRYRRQLINNT